MGFACPIHGGQDPVFTASDDYGVKCTVCGLSSGVVDMDRLPGQIYASLSFGQNILDGSVYEDGIISYNVFMVDDCNVKMGDALATVPVLPSSELPDNCCKHDAYAVDVAVD